MSAVDIPVWFLSDDGTTPLIEIYPDSTVPGMAPALAKCRLPCGFRMRRGRYLIHVAETSDTFGGDRSVAIDGPSRLVITPRDHVKRAAGIALGTGGVVAIIVGYALASDGDSRRPPSRLCSEHNVCYPPWNEEMIGGLLLAAAGLAMTPIGWVMFGKSFRPAVHVEQEHVGSRARGYVGLLGLPGGAGLEGKFEF